MCATIEIELSFLKNADNSLSYDLTRSDNFFHEAWLVRVAQLNKFTPSTSDLASFNVFFVCLFLGLK